MTHECDESSTEQPQDDGRVSRFYAMSLRNVAVVTKMVLSIPVTRVLIIFVGWWVTFLLTVKSSLEDVERFKKVENFEMAEGVEKGVNGSNCDGAEIKRAEDHNTSKSASNTSSRECCDSCDSLEDSAGLRPGAAETEIRSLTWDSVDQAKAKKVLGLHGDTSPGDKKESEATPGASADGEPSTRSTTWGSSKALKVLGFERVNSRFVDAMAADFYMAEDDSAGPWGRSNSCDLAETIEHVAPNENFQLEKVRPVEHNSPQEQGQNSASEPTSYPVSSTLSVKAADFPGSEVMQATPNVTEPVPIPTMQSVAKVAAPSDQENTKASSECLPTWPLRPVAVRNQTTIASTPYRSLIPSDNPIPSHQPSPQAEHSQRCRANSAIHPLQAPSVPHLPRRTSSLIFAQNPIKPLVQVPTLPEPEGRLLDMNSARGNLERPHHHRLWSRFKEEFRDVGNSEGREKGHQSREEGRGRRKEALRGLRFR